MKSCKTYNKEEKWNNGRNIALLSDTNIINSATHYSQPNVMLVFNLLKIKKGTAIIIMCNVINHRAISLLPF